MKLTIYQPILLSPEKSSLKIYRVKEVGLERVLSDKQFLPLFQRSQVQFPAFTRSQLPVAVGPGI